MDFLRGWTIDCEKIPKYNEFESDNFVEPVDIRLASSLLKKSGDWTVMNETSNKKIQPSINLLKSKLQMLKKDKNLRYYQVNGLGRNYSCNDKSTVTLPRKMKQTMYYYAKMKDLDQHKGHPVIGSGCAELNKMKLKATKFYIENDDFVFRQMAEHFGVDIDDKVDQVCSRSDLHVAITTLITISIPLRACLELSG